MIAHHRFLITLPFGRCDSHCSSHLLSFWTFDFFTMFIVPTVYDVQTAPNSISSFKPFSLCRRVKHRFFQYIFLWRRHHCRFSVSFVHRQFVSDCHLLCNYVKNKRSKERRNAEEKTIEKVDWRNNDQRWNEVKEREKDTSFDAFSQTHHNCNEITIRSFRSFSCLHRNDNNDDIDRGDWAKTFYAHFYDFTNWPQSVRCVRFSIHWTSLSLKHTWIFAASFDTLIDFFFFSQMHKTVERIFAVEAKIELGSASIVQFDGIELAFEFHCVFPSIGNYYFSFTIHLSCPSIA